PDDREKTQAAIERALDPRGDGAYSALYRVIGQRDRIERWIEAKGQAFFVNGRPVRLIGTTLDVTARKRGELRLQKSEGMLMRAQRGAKAGVWEMDLVTQRLAWSTPFYELFGLDPSIEPSVDVWLASVHPDDRARIEAAHRRSVEEKTDQDWQFRIIRPDGETRWVRRKGQVEC